VIRPPSPRMAVRVWYRNAVMFKRYWRGTLLPVFLDPVLYFVALGFGLGSYISSVNGVSYSDFIAPGLCASSAMFAASYESMHSFFWRMTESRIHDNMVATPIEPEDVATGELLWAATKAMIYGSVFLIVIAVLGFVDSPNAIALPPFLFLGGLVFGTLAMTYAVLVPHMDYFSFYQVLVMNPMFLFGGVFFPFERLPDWARVLGWFIPTHHLVEIARALTSGGAWSTVFANALWLLVAAVLFAIVPLWKLRLRLVA
jgi:lipooligosaccharide transport system permease protein